MKLSSENDKRSLHLEGISSYRKLVGQLQIFYINRVRDKEKKKLISMRV